MDRALPSNRDRWARPTTREEKDNNKDKTQQPVFNEGIVLSLINPLFTQQLCL